MRRIFQYNFIATKAEEEAAAAQRIPRRVTSTPVEISDKWQIRTTLRSVFPGGLLHMSYDEAKAYIVNNLSCEKSDKFSREDSVSLGLYSEEGSARFTAFMKWSGGTTVSILIQNDDMRTLRLNEGDKIGLYWDEDVGGLRYKVLY